jgi:hypothetical protein
MEISYSADQAALRAELRDCYDRLLDDETMREIRHGPPPPLRRV